MPQYIPPPKPPVINDLYGPVKLYLEKVHQYLTALSLVPGQNISIKTSSKGQTISAIPDETLVNLPFFGSFDGIYYTKERGNSSIPSDLSFKQGEIHFDEQTILLEDSIDLNAANFNALDVTREYSDVWIQVTAGELLLAEFKTGLFPGHNIPASPLLFNYHLGVIYKFIEQDPLVYQWHQTLVGDIHLHLEQTPGVINPPYEDDVEVIGRNIWNGVTNPNPKQFEVYHMGGQEGRPGGPLVSQATLNLEDSVTGNIWTVEVHGNHWLTLEEDGSPVDIDPPPVDPYPEDFEITLAIDASTEVNYDDAIESTLDVTPNNALGTQDVIYYAKVNNQVIDISLTNDDTNLEGSITRVQASADDVYTLYFRGLRCHYNSTVDYFAKLENNMIVSTSATTKVLTMTASSSSSTAPNNEAVDLEVELKGLAGVQFDDFDADGDYEIHVSARFSSDDQIIKIDTFAFDDPPPSFNPGDFENLEFVPSNYDTGKSGMKEDIYCLIPSGRGSDEVVFTITLLYFPAGCILVDTEEVTVPVEAAALTVNSATLNGTTQYFTGSTLSDSNSLHFGCRVKFNTVSQVQILMTDADAAPGSDYAIRINADGKIRTRTKDDDILVSTTALTAGVWYYLEFFADAAANMKSIHIDGVQDAVDNSWAGTANVGNHGAIHIGAHGDGTLREWLDGDIAFAWLSTNNSMNTADMSGTNPKCWGNLNATLQGQLEFFAELGNWTGHTSQELVDQTGVTGNLSNINSIPFTGTGLTVDCP